MAKTLIPNDTFSTFEVPEDGIDRRTASSLEPALQGLTDRTVHLQTRTVGAGGGTGNKEGVTRHRRVTSRAELITLGATAHDKDVALWDAVGFFQFGANTLAGADDPTNFPLIVSVSGVGNWLHTAIGAGGVPFGLAVVDGRTKVFEKELDTAPGRWEKSAVYNVGDRIVGSDDNLWEISAVTASSDQKTGTSEPTWPGSPTTSSTKADNHVTWKYVSAWPAATQTLATVRNGAIPSVMFPGLIPRVWCVVNLNSGGTNATINLNGSLEQRSLDPATGLALVNVEYRANNAEDNTSGKKVLRVWSPLFNATVGGVRKSGQAVIPSAMVLGKNGEQLFVTRQGVDVSAGAYQGQGYFDFAKTYWDTSDTFKKADADQQTTSGVDNLAYLSFLC